MDDLFVWVGWNLLLCIPLGAFVWCLCRVSLVHSRPAVCHALWLLVLLKMVTPAFIPMPVIPSNAGIAQNVVIPQETAPTRDNSDGIPNPVSLTADRATAPAAMEHPASSAKPAIESPTSQSLDTTPAAALPSASYWLNTRTWRVTVLLFASFSLMVTGGIWIMALRQLHRLQRLLAGQVLQSDRASQILTSVLQHFRLPTVPQLMIVDSPIAPIVWGGPQQLVIVLSQQLIQSLSDDELEYVLSHELAHIERRDHWSNLFSFVVATLFWWHPIAWVARRELCLAAELCCDAMVMERSRGSRKSYARTLLNVIDLVDGTASPNQALLLNFYGMSSLRKRIQMLTMSAVKTRISLAGWGFLLLVAVSLLFLPTRAQEQKPSAGAPGGNWQPVTDLKKETPKIRVASVRSTDVTLTKQYVCGLEAYRHAIICAPEKGQVESISIIEGQPVKQGDVLFKMRSTLHQAKLDVEKADAKKAQIEFENTKKMFDDKVISRTELELVETKLVKAQALVAIALEQLNAVTVTAPFDGVAGGLVPVQGGVVQEGSVVLTLSDSSSIWASYSLPEFSYLQHATDDDPAKNDVKVELRLASGKIFEYPGKLDSQFVGEFNPGIGAMNCRAAFPNPQRLLRHGQSGTLLISRVRKDAIAIPQRSIFVVQQKYYVYVVDSDSIAHLREISFDAEVDDRFVVGKGLSPQEKIVVDGVKAVHDGEKIEYENE